MTRLLPRRLLLAALALAGVAALVWLAAAVIAGTRLEPLPTAAGAADGRGGLTVATDFPAATCRKHLRAAWPFVSFDCEPRAAPAP